MNEQLQKEIFSRLDALGAKLGVATEHLWHIVVRQQQIEAISMSIVLVALLIVALCVRPMYKKYFAMASEIDRDGKEYLVVLPAMVWIVCAITGLVLLSNILTCVFNPEYAALENISRLLE